MLQSFTMANGSIVYWDPDDDPNPYYRSTRVPPFPLYICENPICDFCMKTPARSMKDFHQGHRSWPGRRRLIASYLRQLRKCRDGWRAEARQVRSMSHINTDIKKSKAEEADWKADGFRYGVHIIAGYLPELRRAEVSAWHVIDTINMMVSATCRMSDHCAVSYTTGLEACAVWFEPVARRLSGERP